MHGLCPGGIRSDLRRTLVVLDEYPPEELRESVEEAARSCPKQAISVED